MVEEKNKNPREAYITDPELAEMIDALIKWHNGRIEALQQITSAEVGATFEVRNSDGEKVELEGDIELGFKAGVAVAIEVFSPFPVKMQAVHDEEE